MQYREFEGPALVMGRGDWMTKIAAKKIKDYEVGLAFL